MNPIRVLRRSVAQVILPLFATLAVPAGLANAAVIDPAGDFVSTYAFVKNGDLDVLAADVLLNTATSTVTFSAKLAAPIGITPNVLYVFGLDRGQGTQRFVSGTPSTGAGVMFDSVVILRQNTTGQFNDFITPANNRALAAGTASITADEIAATLPLSFFPSQGLDPRSYTFNFWPRLGAGSNAQISDFAPDASNAPFRAVPEPASLGLLGAGVLGLALVRRRRRR